MDKSLLYIKKKDKNKNWSDVLTKQYQFTKKISSTEVSLIEIDTKNIKTYITSILKVFRNCRKFELVYVNHIICAYACLPSIIVRPFQKETKWVVSLHESEPVLGLRHLFKFWNDLSWKHVLRYTFFMDFPVFFFHRIIVLNDNQKKYSVSKYIQLNFLGVDTSRFYPKKENNIQNDEVRLFFPLDPNRPEKGFKKIEKYFQNEFKDLKLVKGGNIPHYQIPEYYRKSDIVIFSGSYETYSIAFIEAIACNKYVVTNKEMGIIQNLLKKYTMTQLKNFGVYVIDYSKDFGPVLKEIISKAKAGQVASSINLINENNLSEETANLHLYQTLQTKI